MKIKKAFKKYNHIYVIGDVHGHPATLKKLIKKIKLSENDALIFVGDLINKGPSSMKVLKYINNLMSNNDVFFCMGNHEYEFLTDSPLQDQRSREFVKKHSPKKLTKKFPIIFKQLHDYIECDSYIIVHAGLKFRNKKKKSTSTYYYYIRNWYQNIDYSWLENRIIVHGHTPITVKACRKMLKKISNQQYINIDTGIGNSVKNGYGYLTALEIKKQKLYHQINVD